ncbi:MAG: penicillin-binding protein [Saprospiraceae bacterium]
MKEVKKELLIRVYIVALVMVAVAALLFYRVAKISIVEGEHWRSMGDSLYLKYIPIVADRGDILAADGSLMTTSLPFYDLHMDFKAEGLHENIFRANVDSLAYYLSRNVNTSMSRTQMRDWLIQKRRSGDRYALLAKGVSIRELEHIKTFPIFRLGKNKGGLIIDPQHVRVKPFKLLASRVLGLDRDNAQSIGLERTFDGYLKGEEGQRLVQRVTGGAWIPVNDLSDLEGQRGSDIVTTINPEIQDIAEYALLDGMEKSQGSKGTAIVMDVESGAILAMANLGAQGGGYDEDYNYAVGFSSEPGSTFKLASVMALLEDDGADLDTPVDLNGGTKKFAGQTMHDSKEHGIHASTLREAFEKSSNVGIAQLVQDYYGHDGKAGQFAKRIREMHLNEPTGIELDGEGAPMMKNPAVKEDHWSGTTLPWMATGYECRLTPLQILRLYNAVANDGKMMKPYIVSEITREGRVIKRFHPEVVDRSIVSSGTIEKAHELLRGVVEEGTAKAYKPDYYMFCGKTGTARTDYYDPNSPRKSYMASFVGYFPEDKPKFSCIVMVYDPTQGGFYGAEAALPVFKKIADRCMGINRDLLPKTMLADTQATMAGVRLAGWSQKDELNEIVDELSLDTHVDGQGDWARLAGGEEMEMEVKNILDKNMIPELYGMGIRDAIYLLENRGIHVQYQGVGRVRSQSIHSGQPIIRGTTIHLTLG